MNYESTQQQQYNKNFNGNDRTPKDYENDAVLSNRERNRILRTIRWLYIRELAFSGFGRTIIDATPTNFADYICDTQLGGRITPCNEDYDPDFNYTAYVNAWIYSNGLVYERTSQRQHLHKGRRIWEFERAMSLSKGIMKAYGLATTLKEAKNLCDYAIYVEGIALPMVQMDGDNSKESVQGLATQESDRASNTIVTRDEDQTRIDPEDEVKPLEFVSTEKTVSVPDVVGRWMPLKTISVNTGQELDTTITTYYLPESLFKEMGSSVNLLPFEAFIYGKYDILMKFVVNANKFQCGKLLVSAKFDSYQADGLQSSVLSGLHRPHVMLDLSTNVEGVLRIPFRYHRSLLRNVKNDSASLGVRPSKYATVDVQVLSPLRTGKDNQTDLYIRPFVKFEKADFAAMSYRVAVQMDLATDLLKGALPTQEVRGVLQSAEKLLKTIGTTANRDKPTTMEAKCVIPRPRLNFGTGKGLIDAVPLRVNPYAMTTFSHVRPFDDEPKTSLDVAKIWGLRTTTKWSASMKPGVTLLSMTVDPVSRSYTKGYEGTPTPLEYMAGMYNFWAGTIEVRVDFVSNAFHTGAVMLAAEYGRPTTTASESEIDTASTYTKTFHLGEQKSVCFTIPYIYDTVWRRSTALPFQPDVDKPAVSDAIKNHAIAVRPDSKTVFKIRVINELRPVQTVSQEIDVLVYWRASPQFMLHGLKQQSFYTLRDTEPVVDAFPANNYKPVETGTEARPKRELAPSKKEHDVPPELANEWNEVDAAKIRVQMDTGEKENEDETLDFAMGKFNLGLQTTDSQLSFKDILRRPVLIANSLAVAKVSGGSECWIPLMPPSREMAYHKGQVSMFSPMIGQTPQAAIMNMFRFWRGTMRYTIVVYRDMSAPIYVTHVPHSGVRRIGNMISGNKRAPTPNPSTIYGSGLSTEVIIPTVNPTVVVELPYDTENDWTLTFEEDAQRNYSWRDKGDTVSGHMVLSSMSAFTVDLWWSAGDDFEIANFYGIPSAKYDDSMYQWNDAHARVQMDFNDSDTSYIRRLIQNVKVPLAVAATSAIPVVGNSLAVTYGAMRVEKAVEQVKETAQEWKEVGTTARSTLSALEDTAHETRSTMSAVRIATNNCDTLLTLLNDKVSTLLDSLINTAQMIPTVRSILEDALIDVLMAWFSKSWSCVGLGLVRIINKVTGGTNKIMYWGEALATTIRSYFDERPQAQADDEKTIVGVLCGLLGTIMGMTIDVNHHSGWMRKFAKIFTTTTGVSYMNQVMRFVQTTFDCIRNIVMSSLGFVDPEVAALQALSKNSQVIGDFVRSAQMCMNEANTNLMLAPSFRLKFWHTTVRAYQIQRALIVSQTNVARPQLLKLCQDVIKHATERFVDLSCSPVRYEPFVICLSGKPGIGKSFMTEYLVAKMMKSINFNRPSSGLVYTRAPGSKYWSSFRDQPVVVYDDWLNLNSAESIEQQISELYQMKSTCRFIPEMAHLEEKRISANPMIVALVCNDAFPNTVSNVAIHTEAVYRRRDLVVDCRLKKEWAGRNLRDELTGEDSQNLEHLEFTIWTDSRNKDSKCQQYKPFNEFYPWLERTYQRYHAQEQINVRRRLTTLQDALRRPEGDFMGDPFELLYTAQSEVVEINQNAWLTSEQLEAAVHELISVVDRVNEVVPITVPPAPERIFTQADTSLVWRLIGSMALGVAATPSLIGWAMETSWQQVSRLLEGVEFGTLPEGDCSICLDRKNILMKCGNCTELVHHFVCAECYQEGSRVSRMDRCPVCRTEELYLNVGEGGGAVVIVCQWILRNGRQYVRPFLAWLRQVANMIPMRILEWINALAGLLKMMMSPGDGLVELARASTSLAVDTVLRPEADVWQEAMSIPFETTVHGLFSGARLMGEAYTMGMAQVDEEEPVADWMVPPPPVEEAPVHAFDPAEFREDVWNAKSVESRHGRCFHYELLQVPLSASYRLNPELNISEWQIAVRDGNRALYVFVEDNPCCETCPFRNTESVKQFYTAWRGSMLSTLRSHLVAVHNNVGPVSDQALAKIPPVLHPEWLTAPTIEPISENWWEYLTGKFEKYKTLIYVCAGVGATIGGLLAMSKLWSAWSAPTLQSDLNYNVSDARQMRRVVTPRVIQPQRLRVQADDLTQTVLEYVIRNYVILKIWEDGKVKRQMALTGICGKYAIMPRHYVSVLNASEDLRITIEPALFINGTENHERMDYAYEPSDCAEMSNTDLAYVRLPNSYPSFKDIRKFFQTEADLTGYMPNEANIVLVPTKKRQALMVKNVDLLGITPRVKFDDVDGSSFWVTDVLKYTHSEAGACGSIVMVEDHQRPLRAMHVAGTSTDIGYGVLLTRELLDTLITDKIVLQYEDVELEDLAEREDAMVFDPSIRVHYLGAVDKARKPFSPKKSKIKPSLIQNHLPPPETAPCILSASDPRYTHEKSPLHYGAVKHGKVTKDFPQSMVKEAEEALWDGLFSTMKPSILNPKRLTIEQAVTGIPGVEFYDPMRLDTSSGYPWQLEGSETTKREWILVERDEHGEISKVELKTKLKEEILRKEVMRKKGIIPVTMFCDTLKDERKKLSKLYKPGATRVFCASPVDYTIATRQNLLHFCAAFMKKRFDVNHAVGVNAKGPEWTELFRRLTAVSVSNIVMMDYSNFGPAFNAVVAESAAEIMIRWVLKYVQGVDETELRALVMECINSVHIAGATVYRQFAGSPSGAAITTIINTLVNLLYLTIAWKNLCGDRAKTKHPDIYRVFRKYTALFAYGDDFIMSVHDDFKDLFTTNTIRDFFARYGIAATSAEKELEVIPDFVPINQASFLKRTFRKHDTRSEMVLGPLEELALNEIPKWIWQCSDKKAATKVNVESALLEAHAYGPEYFKNFKTKLNDCLALKGIEPSSMQWHTLDDMWFEGEMPVVDTIF
nr:polyprotein [Budalangi Iflavi-like virus]